MKKMTTFAAIGLLVLASCSKSTDLYQPPVEPEIPTPVTSLRLRKKTSMPMYRKSSALRSTPITIGTVPSVVK